MPGIEAIGPAIRRALGDEERLHELIYVDAVLAYERANDLAPAQTARTQHDQRSAPASSAPSASASSRLATRASQRCVRIPEPSIA